eukprot:2288653-Rhodomonas_salina.1
MITLNCKDNAEKLKLMQMEEIRQCQKVLDDWKYKGLKESTEKGRESPAQAATRGIGNSFGGVK